MKAKTMIASALFVSSSAFSPITRTAVTRAAVSRTFSGSTTVHMAEKNPRVFFDMVRK
jgi:hypothetical protein